MKQSDYRGTLSITESGLTCQAWDDQVPHMHNWTHAINPNAGLDGNNNCRSPDGAWPWCFTTNPNILWEYCQIPSCPIVEVYKVTPMLMGNADIGFNDRGEDKIQDYDDEHHS